MKTPAHHRIEPLESRIAPAFAASIALGSLNAAAGFKLSGIADGGVGQGDEAGDSVSVAGDVNGDGVDDFIIGALKADDGAFDAGAAYVVFGKAGGLGAGTSLAGLDGTNGFKLFATGNNDRLSSVSAAGDVNGDGFADVIVGAINADEGASGSGAAFVVFGRAGGFAPALSLAALNGSNGFKLSGIAVSDSAGSSVSGAGDVNGDGFDDVIVGTNQSNISAARRGEAYVVFGKAGGFANMALSALNGADGFKLSGVADDDRAGSSVSGAGDVNGDGFDDVIIGSASADEGGTDRGAAYVIFGKAGGFSATVPLAGLNGGNGFKLSGTADNDRAGGSVSGAGDVNGDGYADMIIGATGVTISGNDVGAAYVVFGGASGFGASVALSSLNGSNGFRITGAADGDRVGGDVSAVGDMNGDGFTDVIIGASAVGVEGAAYVVFGKAGGSAASVALSGLNGTNGFKLSGVASGDGAGSSVSAAGDLNRDGFADVIVGAPSADEGGVDRGAAYVIYGQPDVAVKFTAGGKVATFADVDGDIITVKVTKGTLSLPDLRFSNGTLQTLDLATKGALVFGGTNVTVTVKKTGAGDGKFHLGALDAHGLDLGIVTLPGDLGQLDAGDANFKTPAVKALTVGSIGAVAGTQPAGTVAALQSDLVGTLAKLTVKGTMKGVINTTGGTSANIGPVTILSDLDGSAGGTLAGLLRASGNIGPVLVKGSVIGGANQSGIIAGGKLGKVTVGGNFGGPSEITYATISALGDFTATTAAKAIAIAGVSVKGNISNARILAGYTASLGAANPNASIGPVSVGGNWSASSIAAGVDDGFALFGFGLVDSLIPGDTKPALIATIASITIKGTATGSPTVSPFHYGIVAERVVKLKIGTTTHALTNTANDILLDATNNDFRVLDFA